MKKESFIDLFGPRQKQVLKVLFSNVNLFVSREEILRRVDSEIQIYDRTIDCTISRIRKKLRDLNVDLEIESKHKMGYRLISRTIQFQ